MIKIGKIKIQDLIVVLQSDVVKYNSCIEINFGIDNDTKYNDCWLGKGIDENRKEEYWFGLVADGSEAYDYNDLEGLLNDNVFNGKSLREIINGVTWYSLDGCSIEERLPDYINGYDKSPKTSRARLVK